MCVCQFIYTCFYKIYCMICLYMYAINNDEYIQTDTIILNMVKSTEADGGHIHLNVVIVL